MNFGELKSIWREWTHRDNISDAVLSTVEDLLRTRLGRDLRADSNQVTATLTDAGDGIDLSADIKEIRMVEQGRYGQLAYIIPNYWEEYKRNSGYYTIKNDKLFIGKGGQVSVTYFVTPDNLVNDVDTNDTLTQWPSLYLYGGISEIYRYTQENESMTFYNDQYQVELARVNEQAQRKRIGDSPAIGY